jgi:hypothetical protein
MRPEGGLDRAGHALLTTPAAREPVDRAKEKYLPNIRAFFRRIVPSLDPQRIFHKSAYAITYIAYAMFSFNFA